MSFFSFRQKTPKKPTVKADKESYSLVFNISSGSITGALIKFTERVGIDVILLEKEKISIQTETSIQKRLRAMQTTLSSVANKIAKKGLGKIEKTFYLFSSPWSVSQTKTIRVKEGKAFKVTPTYLNKLISSHEKQYQEDIAKAKSFADITSLGQVVDKKIVQIKINDYPVEKVNNQLARDLELSLFFTIVPKEILQAVEDAVSKSFRTKHIWYHASSLTIFSALKDLFPQKDSFLYLDMSDELTDIVLVKDGIMINEASFPIGHSYFIKKLAKEMKVTEELALSTLKLQSNKSNDELAALKLSVALDRVSKIWLDHVTQVFITLKEKVYLPETLFLIINNDLTNFLASKLKTPDLEIILIDQKNIKSEDIIFKINLLFLDKMYKI